MVIRIDGNQTVDETQTALGATNAASTNTVGI